MKYLEQVGMAPYINARPSQISGRPEAARRHKRGRWPWSRRCSVRRADEARSTRDGGRGAIPSCASWLAGGMTMLVVTHEMAFARDVSTHAVFMKDGVIWEQGAPEELFKNPQHHGDAGFPIALHGKLNGIDIHRQVSVCGYQAVINQKESGRKTMHKRRKVRALPALIAVLAAIVCTLVVGVLADGRDAAEVTSRFYGTAWSLLPPVIAIVLALITKEVYSSLFVGILAGGLLSELRLPRGGAAPSSTTASSAVRRLQRRHPHLPRHPWARWSRS